MGGVGASEDNRRAYAASPSIESAVAQWSSANLIYTISAKGSALIREHKGNYGVNGDGIIWKVLDFQYIYDTTAGQLE